MGWGGAGSGNNVLLRGRHVQQLPTCSRHATSASISSKYVVRYNLFFFYLTHLPCVTSSKYVVRYNLFYCCLTYLPYVLPKKIRLYSDGAKAWESLCKQKRINNFPVTHRKQQFTRKLKTWKKPGATIAGTQAVAVDRWWQSLGHFIPSALSNKDWSKGGLNQNMILYMHACVWRYHLPVTADLKSHLGKLK